MGAGPSEVRRNPSRVFGSGVLTMSVIGDSMKIAEELIKKVMGWGCVRNGRWDGTLVAGGRLAVLDRIETAAVAVSCEETIATRSGGQGSLFSAACAGSAIVFLSLARGGAMEKRVSTGREDSSDKRIRVAGSADGEAELDRPAWGGRSWGRRRVFWEGGRGRLICLIEHTSLLADF